MGVFVQKVFTKNALVKSVMLSVGLGVMWGWGYGMLSHPAVNATLDAVIVQTFAESDIQKTATTLRALLSTEATRVQVLQEIVDWTHTKLAIAPVWRCTSLTKKTLKRLATVYDNMIKVEEEREDTLGLREIAVPGTVQKCAFHAWVEKLTAFADKKDLVVVTRVYGLRGYVKESFITWFLAQPPHEVVVSDVPLAPSHEVVSATPLAVPLKIISPFRESASPKDDVLLSAHSHSSPPPALSPKKGESPSASLPSPAPPSTGSPEKLSVLKTAVGQLQAKLQQVSDKLRALKPVKTEDVVVEPYDEDSSSGRDDDGDEEDELLKKHLEEFDSEAGVLREDMASGGTSPVSGEGEGKESGEMPLAPQTLSPKATSQPVVRSTATVGAAFEGPSHSFAEDAAIMRKRLGLPEKRAGKQRGHEGSALLPAVSLEKQEAVAVHHITPVSLASVPVKEEKKEEEKEAPTRPVPLAESPVIVAEGSSGVLPVHVPTVGHITLRRTAPTGRRPPTRKPVVIPDSVDAPAESPDALIEDDSRIHDDTTPAVTTVRKRPAGSGGLGMVLPPVPLGGFGLRHVSGSESGSAKPAASSTPLDFRPASKHRGPATPKKEEEKE